MAKTDPSPPEFEGLTEDVAALAAELEAVLDDMPQAELAELARRVVPFADDVHDDDIKRPKTPEDLDRLFKDRIGVDVPKVAICPGHTAPFEIACDVFFFQLLRVLIIGSRGGAKTSMMAWIDVLTAELYAGFESWTTGPGLAQGERKYEHMLPYVVEGGVIGGDELPHVARSTVTTTFWRNGSKVGIGPGTVAANNGPRAPRLHRDEIELMAPAVRKQAGNIPAGRATKDGFYLPAQIVDTSTMKWAHGYVAQMKDEYETAIREGRRPRQQVRIFCIFEVAQEAPHCRQAPPAEREARLLELERDPCELCDCDTYVSGVWDSEDDSEEPKLRTLADVCGGRFFRCRGFKPLEDIQTLFLENDRDEWEAEQECSQPSKEGVYIRSYSQVRNGIKNYVPDPENGLIYLGVDWGGEDPHSVGWYQRLAREVEVDAYIGNRKKVLPKGALVRFAEIYKGNIGNVALGKRAIARENEWVTAWPGWRVHERYPDSANAAGRMDWRDHLGLPTVSRIKKSFDEEVKLIRSTVSNLMFFVDVVGCPMFDLAIRSWHQDDGHEVHDWSSHPMAECRYVHHNLNVVDRMVNRTGGQQAKPAADEESPDEDWTRDAEIEKSAALVVGPRRRNNNHEVIGVGGAEDSPLRDEGRSMGSGWRAGLGSRGGF